MARQFDMLWRTCIMETERHELRFDQHFARSAFDYFLWNCMLNKGNGQGVKNDFFDRRMEGQRITVPKPTFRILVHFLCRTFLVTTSSMYSFTFLPLSAFPVNVGMMVSPPHLPWHCKSLNVLSVATRCPRAVLLDSRKELAVNWCILWRSCVMGGYIFCRLQKVCHLLTATRSGVVASGNESALFALGNFAGPVLRSLSNSITCSCCWSSSEDAAVGMSFSMSMYMADQTVTPRVLVMLHPHPFRRTAHQTLLLLRRQVDCGKVLNVVRSTVFRR